MVRVVHLSESIMYDYQTLLREHQLKATPQRTAILQAMEEEGHISIEKIYEKIKGLFPSLSLATIYKNMIAMQEQDIVKELKITGFKNRYEIKKMPHHHMVCQKCGSIVDVELDVTGELEALSKSHGFELTSIDLSLSGICQNCR